MWETPQEKCCLVLELPILAVALGDPCVSLLPCRLELSEPQPPQPLEVRLANLARALELTAVNLARLDLDAAVRLGCEPVRVVSLGHALGVAIQPRLQAGGALAAPLSVPVLLAERAAHRRHVESDKNIQSKVLSPCYLGTRYPKTLGWRFRFLGKADRKKRIRDAAEAEGRRRPGGVEESGGDQEAAGQGG